MGRNLIEGVQDFKLGGGGEERGRGVGKRGGEWGRGEERGRGEGERRGGGEWGR